MNTQIASIGELMELWSKAAEGSKPQPVTSYECEHAPQEYVGFTDRYLFCTRCDAKMLDGIWAFGNQPRK